MSYFTSQDVTTGAKVLEILFMIIGFISIYAGIKNARDEKNPSRFGTALFWCALGIVMAFGRWIPDKINGIIVVVMAIPAILNKVKAGEQKAPTKEETEAAFKKIGMKIFIPALTMGVFSLVFSLVPGLKALGSFVGMAVGILLSIILLMLYSPNNKPKVFLNDAERFLTIVGPLSMLPMLLSCLGAIFTQAGVGEVIAKIVGMVIPAGNVNVGIIVYALGMMLFTMIMGNAFAAITVITVGIGGPFVLAYGANPALIGILGLTAGYCGTLCTPMAANFNILPVAILDMKDRMGTIKNQIVPALILIIVHIIYMIIFK